MGKRISISNNLKNILLIIGVVGGIYAFIQFIDFRIKHTVNDEQFIKKVASHVRPYVIFDENESIEIEGGAMQYLESIEVERVVVMKEDAPRFNITITPKNHLAYAPLLEAVIPVMFDITSKRGKGHQWIYELTAGWNAVSSDKENEPYRFRLEILR